MPKIKFTQRALEKLPFSESGQIDYFDEVTPGFGLRVGARTKSFFAMKKVHGKDTRKTIGRLSQYTLEKARQVALDYLQEMRKGVNPTARVRQERATAEAEKRKDITFKEILTDMIEVRGTKMKPGTLKWYEQIRDVYLSDWLELPMRKINRDMVLDRFREISSKSTRKKEGAKGSANAAFRVFKLTWNYGNSRYPGTLPENPVKVLSDLRVWHRLPRRTNHVESHDIKKWYGAVMATANPTMRDYLLLLLFTGMRRSEAAGLKWDDVNFETKHLRVKDTKNGKPLLIPLNSYLEAFFTHRQKTFREEDNDHVFPGEGKTGHMVEPKRAIAEVEMKTGIKFTPHDLRRTLLGVATEIGIDPFIKKALVNHTIAERRDDVTEGYVEITLNRMRKPSQYLCESIMELCGLTPADISKLKEEGPKNRSAEVIPFPAKVTSR